MKIVRNCGGNQVRWATSRRGKCEDVIRGPSRMTRRFSPLNLAQYHVVKCHADFQGFAVYFGPTAHWSQFMNPHKRPHMSFWLQFTLVTPFPVSFSRVYKVLYGNARDLVSLRGVMSLVVQGWNWDEEEKDNQRLSKPESTLFERKDAQN